VKVIVIEPDHVALAERDGLPVLEKKLTGASKRHPDLLRRSVTMRRIASSKPG